MCSSVYQTPFSGKILIFTFQLPNMSTECGFVHVFFILKTCFVAGISLLKHISSQASVICNMFDILDLFCVFYVDDVFGVFGVHTFFFIRTSNFI